MICLEFKDRQIQTDVQNEDHRIAMTTLEAMCQAMCGSGTKDLDVITGYFKTLYSLIILYLCNPSHSLIMLFKSKGAKSNEKNNLYWTIARLGLQKISIAFYKGVTF